MSTNFVSSNGHISATAVRRGLTQETKLKHLLFTSSQFECWLWIYCNGLAMFRGLTQPPYVICYDRSHSILHHCHTISHIMLNKEQNQSRTKLAIYRVLPSVSNRSSSIQWISVVYPSRWQLQSDSNRFNKSWLVGTPVNASTIQTRFKSAHLYIYLRLIL